MLDTALSVPLIPPMVVVSLLHHMSQKQINNIKRPRCSCSMIGNVPSNQIPDDQRVCVLLEEKTESLPSSCLSLALLVFTKQQKTDRKRVFGFEFMEPVELNKTLRDSAFLSGVKTRFRSKTILIAHTQADWGCPRLAESCIFRGPHRRFPCQECVLICFSRRTESSIIGSFSLNCYGASRIEISHWRQCVEKGRGKENIRRGFPALEARRGGHANTAHGYLTASGAVPVCGVCFLNNRKEIIVFEVTRLLSIWTDTPRGFALPTLERKDVDAATVS